MKKFTSILLTLVMLMSMSVTVFAKANTMPYIRHIYGGNNKGDAPISNSFIELYNPDGNEVDLSGYTLTDGTKTIALNGKIPAKGSFLVIGAAEVTTDDFLSYDLPKADMTCDWAIDNKSYTISFMQGETIINSVTAGKSAETKISKQKSLKQNEDGTFKLVVWEKELVTVDDAYVTENAPRNSKGEYGKVHKVGLDKPVYTPVSAKNVRVKGYYNNDCSLQMELVGRHNSGAMNADGGSLEIVTYNPTNGYAYAVSGVKGKLVAVNLNVKTDGIDVAELSGTEYDIKALISGFSYGDITSVAVSPNGKMLAAAIQSENYAAAGAVALFSCENNGSLKFIATAQTGVQPDMVTFADNNTLLTADEGEPRNGVNGVDPKGSVTVAKIEGEGLLTSKQIYFDEYDAKRSDLIGYGVLIQKGKNPSVDFEPEYIAVSGNTAYISLQEANSIAVLNITDEKFTGIYSLGLQDYGKTKADIQKNDKIDIKNYENVFGIKMPDGITVADIKGKTFLLTANEGDSRADWQGMDNEYENVTSPTGNVTLDKKVVWFNAAMWDGLDENKAYLFGGRSFSIYEVTNSGLSLVYDSGSDFEEITSKVLPDFFNASNDKISIDNRSGKKGPEPESVTVGKVGEKIYAFVALERIGGIMVYDITIPENSKFVNYINSREFDSAIQGDVSPEGLFFMPDTDSKTGKALLLAACEVSGTLAVYECVGSKSQPDYENKPEIIKGNSGTWTKGTKDGFTVTSNAEIKDFLSVSVDGKVIDSNNYTLWEGSTNVMLKSEYLATLSVGKHIISVNSVTGSAEAEFEIKETAFVSGGATNSSSESVQTNESTEDKNESAENSAVNDNTDNSASPKTGDNSNILLWCTLLFVSGGAVTMHLICGGRKKRL